MTNPLIPDGPAPKVWTPKRGFQKIDRDIQAVRKRGVLDSSVVPPPPAAALPVYAAHQTVAQTGLTVGGSNFHSITCETATIDTDGMHATTHAVIQHAGVYLVSGTVAVALTTAVAQIEGCISTAPGPSILTIPGTGGAITTSTANATQLTLSPVPLHLNAGDQVWVIGYSHATTFNTVTANPNWSSLAIVCLSLD